MNFIFAKLFEEYKRKNDSPKYSITLYISIFYFFLSFAILLPIKAFIDKKIFNDHLEYEKPLIIIIVFGFFTLITLIVYNIYIKNEHILKLVGKYERKSINKLILYLIIILLPVILVLIAATLSVYLNGGEILGVQINGLLQ
jgi:hypothetical protein